MPRRFRGSRRLALVLALALVGPAHPVPTAARDLVDCPACEGSGRGPIDCWLCVDGDQACTECRKVRPARPRTGEPAWLPRGLVLEHLERSNERNDDLLDRVGELVSPSKGRSPERTGADPGDLECPAKCSGGKLLLIDDWVDCKLCRGGTFRCPLCKKGRLDCEPCDGEGMFESICVTCAGQGRVRRLPDDPTVCPWCLDEGARPCSTCDDTRRVRDPCSRCAGKGEVVCASCASSGKEPCSRCEGRGRHGWAKVSCHPCKAKGYAPCTACADGIVSCPECGGRPLAPTTCRDCAGSGRAACGGCAAGSYLAWERTTEQELDRGDADSAAAWLRATRARCRARYEAVLAKLGDDPPPPSGHDALDEVVGFLRQFPEDLPDLRDAVTDELREQERRLDRLAFRLQRATGARR